jgi:hypothetical protein
MLKNVFLGLCCAVFLAACAGPSGPTSYIGGEAYTNHQKYVSGKDRDDYDMRMGRYRNTHRYGTSMAGSTIERVKGPYNR